MGHTRPGSLQSAKADAAAAEFNEAMHSNALTPRYSVSFCLMCRGQWVFIQKSFVSSAPRSPQISHVLVDILSAKSAKP